METEATPTRKYRRIVLSAAAALTEEPKAPVRLSGMDLDEAFRTVGEFGLYQKQALAIVVLAQVGLFGISTYI